MDGNGESSSRDFEVYSDVTGDEGQNTESDIIVEFGDMAGGTDSFVGSGDNGQEYEAFTVQSEILGKTEEDITEDLSNWAFIGFGGAGVLMMVSLGLQLVISIMKNSAR